MTPRRLRRHLVVLLVNLVLLVWLIASQAEPRPLMWLGLVCAVVGVAVNVTHPNRRWRRRLEGEW